MGLDQKLFGTYIKDAVKHVTFVAVTFITYQMKVNDLVVLVDTTAAAGTITLPPVAECAGRIYSIRDVGDYSGTNNVTIEDKDESVDWGSDEALKATKDSMLLYSDGEKWHKICDNATD